MCCGRHLFLRMLQCFSILWTWSRVWPHTITALHTRRKQREDTKIACVQAYVNLRSIPNCQKCKRKREHNLTFIRVEKKCMHVKNLFIANLRFSAPLQLIGHKMIIDNFIWFIKMSNESPINETSWSNDHQPSCDHSPMLHWIFNNFSSWIITPTITIFFLLSMVLQLMWKWK